MILLEEPKKEGSVAHSNAAEYHAGDPEKDRHTEVASIAIRLCQELLTTIMWNSLRACGADTGCLYQVDYGSRELIALLPVGEGWTDIPEHPRLTLFAPGRQGITSYVVATGAPYVSADVSEDPYYKAAFTWVKSELALPVLGRSGKVIGVLNMESRRPAAFSQAHIDRLEELARQAALVMSLADYEAREKSLLEVGKSLTTLKAPEALMADVVDIAAVLLNAQDCSLFLLEDDNRLTLRASVGSLSRFIQQATYTVGEGLTGWVAEHNQPIRIADPRTDPRWRGLYSEFPLEELGAFMAVPVPGREGNLGVMRVVRRKWLGNHFGFEFTEDDEELMITLASQLGVALDNAKLLQKLVEVERVAAWGQMSARAAHMIGNTVFAVKGDLNELNHRLQQNLTGLELTGLIESANKSIFRLEEMLQEFRDFVTASRLDLSRRDLDPLVSQLVAECFPRGTGVRLMTEFHAEGVKVEVDVAKLSRCFEELISDSLRALNGSGTITVRTAPATEQDAEIVGTPVSPADFVKIEVSDDGPGIGAASKDNIFTPFFTTRAKGMGLGLTIVKGIIEGHGGIIREVGEEGKGARFLILLPRLQTRGKPK